ncbi:hypothetical protein [Gracilibacillus phocaeensis]|uniref:hypothetical protein n=1 Tax=Gracilibacillus phocaeensis TaxID=2042304 RepID=UPI0013EF4FE3|nr:hypothetical protein [Gracilibacillus phocaeensis]
MNKVMLNISMSLDGYIAGSNDHLGEENMMLKSTKVIEGTGVIHVKYDIVK